MLDERYSSGGAADAAGQLRKRSTLDEIRDNAAARLSATRARLQDILNRLVGPPPSPPEGANVREAVRASGFISGAGSALELVHVEITHLDEVLQVLAEHV